MEQYCPKTWARNTPWLSSSKYFREIRKAFELTTKISCRFGHYITLPYAVKKYEETDTLKLIDLEGESVVSDRFSKNVETLRRCRRNLLVEQRTHRLLRDSEDLLHFLWTLLLLQLSSRRIRGSRQASISNKYSLRRDTNIFWVSILLWWQLGINRNRYL